MNRRFATVLLFALVVSGAASLLVYHFVIQHMRADVKAPATGKLLVAAHDLQIGDLLGEQDLTYIDWSGVLPPQTIKNKQEAIGRGVVATIYQGEPLLDVRLAPKGAGAGLAAIIPVGSRAVALKVDEVVGLAGFVLPGMRVDVIVSSNGNGDPDHRSVVSRTVLQNIKVLSAGQRIEKSPDGKPETAEVVNLLVTPDQAEVMTLASSETKVQLVLRNPLDTKEEATHGTSLASLLGKVEEPVRTAPVSFARPHPVVAPPVHEMPVVEVYSGTKKSEQQLDDR